MATECLAEELLLAHCSSSGNVGPSLPSLTPPQDPLIEPGLVPREPRGVPRMDPGPEVYLPGNLAIDHQMPNLPQNFARKFQQQFRWSGEEAATEAPFNAAHAVRRI